MRTILLCAFSALTLAACQQPATPAETEAPAAADAGMEASAPAEASSGAMAPASGSAAPAPSGDASDDTMGAAPTDDGAMTGPTTQDTRDMAKQKAEETNLHPRTP